MRVYSQFVLMRVGAMQGPYSNAGDPGGLQRVHAGLVQMFIVSNPPPKKMHPYRMFLCSKV